MRMFAYLLAMSFLITPSIASADYSIKATVKTVSKERGDKIKRGHGDVQITTSEKSLELEVRRTNPNAPETVTVRWVVLREGSNEKLYPGTTGEETVTIALGTPVEVVSGTWLQAERDRDSKRGRNSSSSEIQVYGYGILVVKDGEELAAKFSPSSCEPTARNYLPACEISSIVNNANKRDPVDRMQKKSKRRMP